MRKLLLVAGALLLPLALVIVPLSAVMELPLEKDVKTALGLNYPKSCEDYETVGRGRPGAWREEPALPALRDEPRGVVMGGRAYLAGGLVEEGDTTRSVRVFETFDFGTGRYARLPAMPMALNHVGIAEHDGVLYVAGGLTGGLGYPVATDKAWRYDPTTRTWAAIESLPRSRGAHGLEVVGDRMYAVGGLVEGIGRVDSLADVDAYDFATGEWSARAPMSEGKDHLATTVHDGMIYALGGRQGRAGAFSTFERYDPERDRWERLPDYPLPVSGSGLVSVDGRLIAAGGEDPGRGLLIGRAYEYDLDGRRWTPLPAMARPKHGFGDLAANGRFWAFGGAECYGFEPARSVDSLDVSALR